MLLLFFFFFIIDKEKTKHIFAFIIFTPNILIYIYIYVCVCFATHYYIICPGWPNCQTSRMLIHFKLHYQGAWPPLLYVFVSTD